MKQKIKVIFITHKGHILLFLFTMITILWLVFVYFGNQIYRLQEKSLLEKLVLASRILAVRHEQNITETRSILNLLTLIPQSDSCTKIVTEFVNQHPQYYNLAFVDKSGEIVCSALPVDQSYNVLYRPYIQQVLQTKNFSISQYQIGVITKKPSINIAVPFFDEEKEVAAVAVAALNLSWMDKLAEEVSVPPDAVVIIVDRDGTVLHAYPDSKTFMGKKAADTPIIKIVLQEKKEGTAKAVGLDGKEKYYAYVPLHGMPKDNDVYVIAGIAENSAFLNMRSQMVLIVCILIAATAVVFTVFLLESKYCPMRNWS